MEKYYFMKLTEYDSETEEKICINEVTEGSPIIFIKEKNESHSWSDLYYTLDFYSEITKKEYEIYNS